MATLPADPYKILGVAKDAQVTEIRSAHRKLVLKCHPDKVQDPALKAQKQDEFQKVQQAYELLTDEKERQKYDDQVKLAELRKQMGKANISTPRTASKHTEYEVRTPETRPTAASYQTGAGTPPVARSYSYSRSWDDEVAQSPRIFESASSRPSRRETKYNDVRPKKDSDREREKDKEAREREKERERERRKKADKSDKEDSGRRSEKESRRSEKKVREKTRDKETRRESDDKKKHSKPYIEEYSDEPTPTKSEKKKVSGSKKYEEKPDRSAHQEDAPQATRTFTEYATSTYEAPRVPPAPEPTWSQSIELKSSYATSYIEASRAKEPVTGLKRSMTYHPRMMDQPPAAPTPPPAPSQSSPFSPPDEQDDVRRSSARPRRGSSESNRMQRDKAYRKSSREPLEEPSLSASPNTRHTPQFSRANTSAGPMSGSPPRLSRTNSMPPDAAYSRSMPVRSQTFTAHAESADARGRNRSRMQPQINEETDSDDVYDARTRDRKYRSSRKTRSPEAVYVESRYPYESRQGTSYSRRPETEGDAYYYSTSGGRSMESRPTMPARDAGYSTSSGSAHFSRVKTSKTYGYDDVQYTHHQKPREEYPVYG